jgi:hypothetical protein
MADVAISQESLPPGWRKPTATEANGAWRKKGPARFLVVKADFDGDGATDVAELLINGTKKQFALFVMLGSSRKWQMLGEPSGMEYLDRFGIDLVKPGKYETACGKGYGDYACAHGEPDSLNLSRPAIDFFYTESSDSIVFWEPNTKSFHKVLMSD